jgi:glucan phosphorylase
LSGTPSISDLIIDVLRHRVGKDERAAKPHDWFQAAVLSVRDRIIDRWFDRPAAPMKKKASASITSRWNS